MERRKTHRNSNSLLLRLVAAHALYCSNSAARMSNLLFQKTIEEQSSLKVKRGPHFAFGLKMKDKKSDISGLLAKFLYIFWQYRFFFIYLSSTTGINSSAALNI